MIRSLSIVALLLAVSLDGQPAPVKRPAPRAARGAAKPPQLKLELEQDGAPVAVQEHAALLRRAAFTLYVTIPDKEGVFVSASFDPGVYDVASSGRPFGKAEFRSAIAGAEGKANEGHDLFHSSPADPTLHFWTCDPGENRRFDSVSPQGPGCRGQRSVANLFMGEAVPIEKLLRRPLHVVVFRGKLGDEGPLKETGREWLKVYLGTAPESAQAGVKAELDALLDAAKPLTEREAALRALAARGRDALLTLDAVSYAAASRAREEAALADVRTIIAAAKAYSASNGGLFDAPPCLIDPGKCLNKYRGPAFLTPASLETRGGYKKIFVPGAAPAKDELKRAKASATSLKDFVVLAWPETYGESGERAFCGDWTGRVCWALGASPPAKDGRCLPGCTPLD